MYLLLRLLWKRNETTIKTLDCWTFLVSQEYVTSFNLITSALLASLML